MNDAPAPTPLTEAVCVHEDLDLLFAHAERMERERAELIALVERFGAFLRADEVPTPADLLADADALLARVRA